MKATTPISVFLIFKGHSLLYGSFSLFIGNVFGNTIPQFAVIRVSLPVRQKKSPVIIGIQIIQVVVCVLPGQPIQFAASYMFGVGIGYLLSVIGAMIGTTISFYLAKLLGSEAMHLFFGEEKITEYHRRLNSGRGLLLAFLIYLIPGVPKDLVSYAAGISEMRFRPFLLAATIGRSPAMLGSLLVGHFYGKQNYTAIIIITAAILLILLICFIKRDKLIEVLDRIEMKDAESEVKTDG